MYTIYDCVNSFCSLLDTEYHLVLGRKGVAVESSDHYYKIAERIELLPHLEDLFDSNDTVFKYNEKINAFSMIQADYLMKNRIQDKNVFLFLAKDTSEQALRFSFQSEKRHIYFFQQVRREALFCNIYTAASESKLGIDFLPDCFTEDGKNFSGRFGSNIADIFFLFGHCISPMNM
ncbi:MAG: PBECR4 domain-containing protein [Clostridium sp.]|nr:PBECR4 domain-containing protein [Clostridium sp.]